MKNSRSSNRVRGNWTIQLAPPLDAPLTLGERLADRVASFGGSWTFMFSFAGVLVFWVLLNTEVLARLNREFDPYPFILLNLFLSMLAAIQAPVIMMSQNRQSAKDRLQAADDYEVNLRAEAEVVGLHEKLDAMRAAELHQVLARLERRIDELASGRPGRGGGCAAATTKADVLHSDV